MNVEQVMINPVITVDPGTLVGEACELLESWGCRHLPVMAKFFPAIVSLGGLGQHLHEQRGIKNCVMHPRGKFEGAANDR